MNTILKLATASVAALALAVPLTHAQETEGDQIERPGGGMMRDMMEGHGMMGHGMRGDRMRGHGMLLIMFAMMDTNGDEALSVDEVLAVHRRLFAYVDVDGDGALTPEEVRNMMSRMHGRR